MKNKPSFEEMLHRYAAQDFVEWAKHLPEQIEKEHRFWNKIAMNEGQTVGHFLNWRIYKTCFKPPLSWGVAIEDGDIEIKNLFFKTKTEALAVIKHFEKWCQVVDDEK